MNERRKDRSRFKDVALQTWLDAVAQRQKIDGIVVADAIGLLVAGGLDLPLAEEMAATAARRTLPGDKEVTFVDAAERSTVIRSLTWNDELLYVSARGDLTRGRAAIEEAISGIDRILNKP